jgi:hypothetical protein
MNYVSRIYIYYDMRIPNLFGCYVRKTWATETERDL